MILGKNGNYLIFDDNQPGQQSITLEWMENINLILFTVLKPVYETNDIDRPISETLGPCRDLLRISGLANMYAGRNHIPKIKGRSKVTIRFKPHHFSNLCS